MVFLVFLSVTDKDKYSFQVKQTSVLPVIGHFHSFIIAIFNIGSFDYSLFNMPNIFKVNYYISETCFQL